VGYIKGLLVKARADLLKCRHRRRLHHGWPSIMLEKGGPERLGSQ
jgi:hypothetical protein